MIDGSISENKDVEKRISITPDIAKKYISSGFQVLLESDYGSHLCISDDEFLKEGCKIEKKENIPKNSDIFLQLDLPEEKNLEFLPENKILIEAELNNFKPITNTNMWAGIHQSLDIHGDLSPKISLNHIFIDLGA